MSCTGVKLTSNQGKTFWGRTQEFDINLNYSGMIIPKDYDVPLSFINIQVKHNFAGLGMMQNGQLIPIAIDGINEKGLCGGSFYFANYNNYIPKADIEALGKKPLNGVEFVTWALATCDSVEELREKALTDVAIASDSGIMGPSIPQHYVFQDTTGKSIVIEPSIPGGFEIYDNPIGVFTNNPKFDWHLVNLQNYVGLQQEIHPAVTLDEMAVFSSGKGNGLFGLPGDFTPQSRFIRAAILKAFSTRQDDDKTVELIFHILDTADIPKGVVKTDLGVQYTQYTSAYDLEKKQIYIHTYDNRQIQTFSLADLNCSAVPVAFEIVNEQQIAQMKKINLCQCKIFE